MRLIGAASNNNATRANVIFNFVYVWSRNALYIIMLLLRVSWKIDIVKWVLSLNIAFVIFIISIILLL